MTNLKVVEAGHGADDVGDDEKGGDERKNDKYHGGDEGPFEIFSRGFGGFVGGV